MHAYLDDAPLEERRTPGGDGSRRWLAPEDAADLGRLDPDAIARVREEAWPQPANAWAKCTTNSLVWLGCLAETEVGNTPSCQAGWLVDPGGPSRRAAAAPAR